MIFLESDHPKQSIYYIGAQIISVFKEERVGVLDSVYLFEEMNSKTSRNISFTKYMYALNWLYLLDVISLEDNGDIRKCF